MSKPGPIEEALPTSAEPEPITPAVPTSSRRMIRRVALVAWLTVIVAWTLRLRATGTSPLESLQGLVDRLDGAWWAIPAYVAVYTVRPLVLFPASLLTVAGGLLFGPVVGLGAAVVGANLSALVAFRLDRVFGPAALTDGGGATVLARWSGRLRVLFVINISVARVVQRRQATP